MRIEIAQRLRPFTHCPGTVCLLPGSSWLVQVFPTLLRFSNIAGSLPVIVEEVSLNVQGPVKDFTVLLDLEKGSVRVWGKTATGFMRYRLFSSDEGKAVVIKSEKQPSQKLCWPPNIKEINEGTFLLPLSDNAEGKIYEPPVSARLSLGNHKKQDWTLVSRRQDLREIFPAWLRLGSLVPDHRSRQKVGTAALLEECRQTFGQPELIAASFEKLFLAGFYSLLAPRLLDDDHQGLCRDDVTPDTDCSPLVLCKQGAQLINDLFVRTDEDSISVLPALPPQFHCGRFLDFQCGQWGKLNLEWSKKQTRRMMIISESDGEVHLLFQKKLKSFRLRRNNKDKGTVIRCGSPIQLARGQSYLLDRFQK